jgi:S-adenosylmethionine-diacylglycerol 3-amino-3-carboxypropyl transferase
MSAPDLALGDRLLYGACWEDLEIARAALRIPSGGLVVAIGSAGDNAIGLLLDDPGRVVAVDVNPAQTALIELKLAALRCAPSGLAAFVGGIPGPVGPGPGRLATYEALRPMLPPSAARHWDAHAGDITVGVIQTGRFERYLAWFRRALLPVVPGREAVRRMLDAQDVDEQGRLYREQWDSAAWRGLFRVFFSRRLMAAMGRDPAFFDRVEGGNTGAHFLSRAIEGLTATPIRSNPYVTFMLSGSYRIPDAAPAYLQPAHVEVLADRARRIQVVTGSLIETLRELPDRTVDAFYLSDIFELLDPDGYETILVEIARTGRPQARLCYWNNLVPRTRPASLADRLSSEMGVADELHARDRAFIYSRFVVETVRESARVGRSGGIGHAA